jgi:carotenoid cleavage dioxygenase-like enzyme
MRDAPGKALLVPRDGSAPIELPVPPGFVFHWSGAWEDSDTVILEGIEYPGFPKLDGIGEMFDRPEATELLARPVRLTIDLSALTVERTVLADAWMELPSQVGQGADRVMVGVGAPLSCRHPFLSAIVRIGPDGATAMHDLAPGFPGEPVVAGEHLLIPLYRHDAPAQIVVMAVEDLSVVARIQLPHPVPLPLHGTWLPTT